LHFMSAIQKSLPTGRNNIAWQHAPVLRITPLRLSGNARF
jgi:hypothetical protein